MNKCFFKACLCFCARISGIINAKLFPNYININCRFHYCLTFKIRGLFISHMISCNKQIFNIKTNIRETWLKSYIFIFLIFFVFFIQLANYDIVALVILVPFFCSNVHL